MTATPVVRSDRTRDERNAAFGGLRLDDSEGALVRREAARRRTSRDGQRGLPPTAVQLAVLDLLSRGLTADAVATRLGVSVATVRTHVTRLYGRLDAVNAAHAVRRGFELGLLVVDDRPREPR